MTPITKTELASSPLLALDVEAATRPAHGALKAPAPGGTRPERMKVLYLMDCLNGANQGGTEGQFLQLLSHLDRNRFEPQVVVFRSTPYLRGIEAFDCPINVLNLHKLAHPGAVLRLLKLGAFIRRRGFRLVHIFLNDASLAAPIFCRLAGAEVVVSRRDMGFWYTTAQLAVLRASNLFVTRMIANSDAVRQNVHRREGYPLGRTEVFYNGHDPARFDVPALPGLRERLNIGAADPIVGMVANLNPWKRHIDLLQAFALVRRSHPHAHLLLAGVGSLESSLRESARRLELEPVVHFLGRVVDAVPVVHHFSVGILCSESEGLSNAVLEYMGCGKPTVCTNVGGNGEIVKEGETGFLVAPGDIGLMADRISTLLAQASLAELMGHRARQMAQGLTSGRMAELHMSLYERLAGSRPAAHGRHAGAQPQPAAEVSRLAAPVTAGMDTKS